MSNYHQYANEVLAQQAGQIEETNGFAPMPVGDYVLMAVDAEVKNNGQNAKDPNGKYIEICFEVCQENGAQVGRKVFKKFNHINMNQKTRDIDLGLLKAFVRVTVGELRDNEQFTFQHVFAGFNRPFIGAIKITKNEYQGQEYINNELSSFKAPYNALNQSQPQQQAQQNYQGQQQAGGNSTKPTWNR